MKKCKHNFVAVKMELKLLSEGAEAKIYLVKEKVKEENKKNKKTEEKSKEKNEEINETKKTTKTKIKKYILKERIKKNYRHKKLDEKIINFRTKREYKILKKLEEITEKQKEKNNEKNVFFPKAIKIEKNKITLQYIEGKEYNKIIKKLTLKEKNKIIKEIAKKIFLMHKKNIIHSDITPKNILLDKNLKVYFIDFGLSFFSERIEDKVYDLYMTKETFSEEFYNKLLKEYKKMYKKTFPEKIKLLEERIIRVEKRGKNKQKQRK